MSRSHCGLFVIAMCGAHVALATAQARPDAAAPPASGETSAISLVFGSGSVTSAWFTGLYTHPRGFVDNSDLGGLTVGLRAMMRAPFAPSRLRVGGEIGIFMIMTGDAASGSVSCGLGCTYTGFATSPPDDAGINLGGSASLRLFTAGRVALRVGGSGGLLILNLNDAGPAKKQNYAIGFNGNTPYFTSAPGTALYYSVRIVPTIMVFGTSRAGLAIDPYISLLKAGGETAVKSVTYGAAFVVQW
jgi:hypothetical protein